MSMHEFELHDGTTPRYTAVASCNGLCILSHMRAPPPPPPRGPTPPRGPPQPKAGPPPRPTVKPTAKPRAARKLPAWLMRAQRLLLQPAQEWATIAGEFTNAGTIYWRFLAPMAAIGPIAATAGGVVVRERGSPLPFGTIPVRLGAAAQAGGAEGGGGP